MITAARVARRRNKIWLVTPESGICPKHLKENAKNSEKSGTIKLSPTEAGEVLSSFKTRIPFLAFHRSGEDTTIIKFTPWDKKKKEYVVPKRRKEDK